MTELILPAGYDRPPPPEERALEPYANGRGIVVNETDISDELVMHGVQTYFEEHASLLGLSHANGFQMYANSGGSLLTRSRFHTPSNVREEIMLARDLAERDDDIASAIGAAIVLAFGDGMRNQHKDEITVALFDEIAKLMGLDHAFKELYREYLVAGQFTTATLFTPEEVSYLPAGGERERTRVISCPRIGVLPSEQIAVLDNDLFGTASLWYRPANSDQEKWLVEFFAPQTSPARKAEMRALDPVLAFLVVQARKLDKPDYISAMYGAENENPATGEWVFRLNPSAVHRTTMPKGTWPHPRPPMTRNFPLLEAKRLLNLMDYALLEGGSNFLVVAKKGSDARPALPEEVANLQGTIRRAARAGVLVGDHRLSIEIITPDLSELLNPTKRRLLGRKLAKAILRIPDYQDDSQSGQAALSEVEILTRVVQGDRRDIRRHVENNVYDEAAKRNGPLQGAAHIWFPRIILQGAQYFTDMVLKLRDRGDISRRSAIEAGGFNYDAEIQQRKREKANGDDRVMTPAAVPFSSPNAGPQDNNSGRPRGSGPNNGAAGASRRPEGGSGGNSRTIARNAGETVRAVFEEELGWARAGDLTYALLEEYADSKEVGRITTREREALDMIASGEHGTFQHGALTIIPVNTPYEIGEVRAVRLTRGLSALVGAREHDDAIVTRALVFRSPDYSEIQAEEQAMAWGFGPVEDVAPTMVAVLDEPGGTVIGAALVPGDPFVH